MDKAPWILGISASHNGSACLLKGDRIVVAILRLEPFLKVLTNNIPILIIPHHYGHALSVFATSGFAESAVLIVDGTGSPVAWDNR